MGAQLTDSEKAAVKSRFDALGTEQPTLKFKERFQAAVLVLPADRQPRCQTASPYLYPWLGVPKMDRAKGGRPRKARGTEEVKKIDGQKDFGREAAASSRDRMMDALEGMGEALVELVATQIAIRFEATGARFQEKTAVAETQLRKLRDVRRDLIAAKAKGDAIRADALTRELENLQAWAATGPRAAAEVGE